MSVAQMLQRVLGCVFLLCLVAHATSCAQRGESSLQSNPPVQPAAILSAFPEPNGIFATWWTSEPAESLALEWFDESGQRVDSVDVTDRTSWSVDQLPDGQRFTLALSSNGLSSTISRLEPTSSVAGRYALFHEGHGATALGPSVPADLLPTGGRDMVDQLLAAGFTVYTLDMPLEGRNRTGNGRIRSHTDLAVLDSGGPSPVGRLLVPAKLVIDEIMADAADDGIDDPLVLMMGRSGGGWTTHLIGAMDERVDVAVSVAGGLPQSQHLLDPAGPWQIGDYEQYVPHIYDIVGVENLIASAGSSALFLAYSPVDLCCHRLGATAPFVDWLQQAEDELGKPIAINIDPGNRRHGLSPMQVTALDEFLAQITSS